MRRICVLTGSRAEYGLLKPVMKAIKEHPALELYIIATGMHLSKKFGYSINEIVKDGFKITEKLEMNPEKDSGLSMAQAIGKGIIKIANALKGIKPDILLVLGDRIEPLAGTIAASYMNIPVAHIHGGDSARAGLDESARHTITKFAHIHFPATKKSAQRILKLGEDPWRIHIVGAPALDTILNMKFLQKNQIEKRFNINLNKPLIVLIQHAVTTEPEKVKSQIIETLRAIKKLKYQTVVIYPNSDTGGRKIIEEIKKCQNLFFARTYKNLSQVKYFSLLKFASVLVGNSSSGIIESPSFKLASVNIGIRQEGRQCCHNVIDVPHNKNKIIKAIRKAIYDKKFKEKIKKCKNPYGDGKTGKRIAKILSEVKLDKKLLQKKITY